MRVKAADIARGLGLSRATVSLALNGKPGVSEETRQSVLSYKEMMERRQAGQAPVFQEGEGAIGPDVPRMIKLVMYDRGLTVLCDPSLNIWPVSLREFDRIAKEMGYAISVTYVNLIPGDVAQLIEECNSPSVSGVILYATEMRTDDFEPFRAIQKPMVIYDNDFSHLLSSVVADNSDMVQYSVHYLVKKGYRDLCYLAQNIWIYNFSRRRIGFLAGLYTEGLQDQGKIPVETGETIEEIEAFMTEWLSVHPLPDALIMENYRVTIGTTRALRKLGIRSPEDIGLLGIDEVSPYMTGDQVVSCIQIDHTDRVQFALDLLIREIEGRGGIRKQKIVSRSRILEGETLR